MNRRGWIVLVVLTLLLVLVVLAVRGCPPQPA